MAHPIEIPTVTPENTLALIRNLRLRISTWRDALTRVPEGSWTETTYTLYVHAAERQLAQLQECYQNQIRQS